MPKIKVMWIALAGLIGAVVIWESPLATHYLSYCETDRAGKETCAPEEARFVLVRKSAKFLDDHNGAIIALFTIILAVFTVRLAIATDALVSNGKKTAKQQLRAYLGIDSAEFEQLPVPGESYNQINGMIKLSLKNYGLTPAYDAVVKTEFVMGNEDYGKTIIPFSEAASTNQRISFPPGKLFTLRVRAFNRALNRGEWGSFRQENKIAYIRGRIVYADAFKESHFVDFQLDCYFGSISAFGFCEQGNESD